MPEPRCCTCNQMILPGEEMDDFEGSIYHVDPDQCLAAAVRRCTELVLILSECGTPNAVATGREIVRLIQQEFPEAANA